VTASTSAGDGAPQVRGVYPPPPPEHPIPHMDVDCPLPLAQVFILMWLVSGQRKPSPIPLRSVGVCLTLGKKNVRAIAAGQIFLWL